MSGCFLTDKRNSNKIYIVLFLSHFDPEILSLVLSFTPSNLLDLKCTVCSKSEPTCLRKLEIKIPSNLAL